MVADMTRPRIGGTIFLAWTLVAAGCGGAAPQLASPPTSAPVPASAAPDNAEEPTAPAEETDENKKQEREPRADSTLGGPWSQGATRSADQLLGDLVAAEALALSSGRDCPQACRALHSMQRAANGICELATETSERCTAARQRVDAVRDKVSAACGECPSRVDTLP